MNRLTYFLPLFVFGILAALLWRGLSLDPTSMPSALLDKPIPSFALPSLQDPQRTLTQQDIIGHKTLINVWATWCITCRVEHPFLFALKQQGVSIVGVNYKDNPDEARQWLAKKSDPYRFSIQDTEGHLGIDLGVFGAPETYFVDSTGIIRYKHVGDINARNWQETLKPVYDSLH